MEIKRIPLRTNINGLLLDVQPAHLQVRQGAALESRERDVVRAERLRAELGRRPGKSLEKGAT